ncbi:unnamed protein product [Nippostrongylus brasiliensis]|uniref:NIDO domain-containing protein n=1 Tax=Nippostrongylus brasiliensis TaxID=27835 RepID=A0A0N4Y4J7_NIPBR|nr:unnamed protein product [Nippostrongylus brasiliensis]
MPSGGEEFVSLGRYENVERSTPQVYPSFWYQDNTNQRLVHQVNEGVTVYALQTYAFWVRYNNKGSILEQTHNHKEVFVYDGDPDSVVLEGSSQTAFLLTAFADAENGALLGWDTFFTSVSSADLYQVSYWYDTMLPAAPNATLFDPPSQCQPGTNYRSNRVAI